MYNISQKDYYCLLNLLDAIDKIRQYSAAFTDADDFNNSYQAFDASMMNFIVIGEMVEKLSDDLLNASDAEIGWSKIRGFRNILAHNYFGIDAEEVWQIIHNSLPQLEKRQKVYYQTWNDGNPET
jgi:uncharacterized protein with HEPN domain